MIKFKYDLDRFIVEQDKYYETAKREILNGRKESHWIWFIFPQIRGLGTSVPSVYYGLDGKEETKEYYANEVLRSRLVELCNILLDSNFKNIEDVFGGIDSIKLRSSMTIFYLSTEEKIFKDVIDKYYDGKLDSKTIKLLEEQANKASQMK